MILLCGIPSETPLAMVQEQLAKMSAPYLVFNQRQFESIELEFEISGAGVTGEICSMDRTYRLEHFRGIYTRLMDDRLLPELLNEPPNSPKRRYCRSLHDALIRWSDITPCRVLNRTGPMGSNFSKPYQAQLIRRQGFLIPETLITNDPELVLEFRSRHPRVIYKSISGIRSIVQTLSDEDLQRLHLIRWCPTQFQEFIDGINVRVHVIGEKVFATAASTSATDYRYAFRQVGDGAELRAIEISDELAEKCVRLSQALELDFTGIDLKITADGKVYCFEVNPCPAFSYYEANTGQPIAQSVAQYLIGAE